MTSKIKVDNINKVSDDSNIIKKCGTTTTIGSGASNPIVVDGSAVTLGRCGGTVALASGATQTGFGRTGTVDWQTTPKTGDFTAVNGEGYFVNTTSGAVVMTMPSGSAGAIVSIQDYNKTFDSNNFTVTPASGEKINGGVADGSLIISTEGQGLTFVYVDGTVGWKTVHENEFIKGGSNFIIATGGTITTSGNDKIHTFTGPGTFAVSSISGTAAENIVSYMVVAGAGGGGAGNPGAGGGGGAGGFRELKSPTTPYTASPLDGYPSSPNRVTISATSFPITVGAGGGIGPASGSPPANQAGGTGSNSIFSTITSAGGGGARQPSGSNPGNGGSGGGAGTSTASGGSGNTPPTTPAQGTNGGTASPGSSSADAAGGGGGATSVGGNGANPGPGGNGGDGATTSITGSPVTRAGGGGGGKRGCGPSPTGGGGGGPGGGTAGVGGTSSNASSAAANTGSGGGGAAYNSGSQGDGGAGGSGIVVIRYKFQ